MRHTTLLLAGITVLALARSGTAGDDKLEPGYTLLFNGKDLDGWKQKSKKGEALDGKTEAFGGRFKIKDKMIVIDPTVKGDVRIETVRTFAKDVHIIFDFRPGPKCNNDLFIRGHKFDLVKGNVKNYKEGEWHKFEIIVKGDMTEFKCNGESQRKGKNKSASSTFEVRAEFGSVEIKNMRFKEE